jgi:hypothetical protein
MSTTTINASEILETFPYAVPHLLSWHRDGKSLPRLVLGNGSAGWGVASFKDAEGALLYATDLPEASRTRAHARIVAFLEAEVAAGK